MAVVSENWRINGVPVKVVTLDAPEEECIVCGENDINKQGLAVYEGEIVPDNHAGEWGGVPCCRRCYQAYTSGVIKPGMNYGEARRAILANER